MTYNYTFRCSESSTVATAKDNRKTPAHYAVLENQSPAKAHGKKKTWFDV